MKIAVAPLALAVALAVWTGPRLAAVDYQKNLAQVPATDPAQGFPVVLLEAVRGQHPRLLFSRQDMAQRRRQADADPLLRRMCDDVSAQYRRFRFIEPKGTPDLVRDDTAALVTGFDNYAGLAVAYALDGDPGERENIIKILRLMLAQPYWADGEELDSSMGAGNNLLMAALLFDAVAGELEPDFRRDVARALLLHARRLYYLGFLERGTHPIKYWQQDPQNNHRWHRTAGLAAALLAVADEPGLDTGWLLAQLRGQMDTLVRWLPPDGDCHEGAEYQVFGFIYLAMAAQTLDRNLGTDYLRAPGFRNAWAQQVYYHAPGRQGAMSFGDASNLRENSFGHRDAAFFLGPHLTGDRDAQAALSRLLLTRATTNKDRPYVFPWTLLVFYDPSLGEGSDRALPTCRLFPDLGAASLRDSWADDAVCFTFKCGPPGGYRLNAFAHENPVHGQPRYINVAHDDPDANSFALAANGDFFFHPGNYTERRKLTLYSNTLTVDGRGQAAEGDGWLQPVPGCDMRELAYLTGWKTGDAGRIIIEGEAGPAYRGQTAPEAREHAAPGTALKRFRRTAVWLPGEYLLLLDDVVAERPARILWRGIPYIARCQDPEEGRCASEARDGRRVGFQMRANRPLSAAFDYLLLDGRWENELVNQCEFYADTDAIKFACLLDPWKRRPDMTFTEAGDVATLRVRLDGHTDTWTWTPARDARTPSGLVGERDGQPLIALTENDRPPRDP